MIAAVIAKEFRELARDRRIGIIAIVLSLLALVAIVIGTVQQARYADDRRIAVAADQSLWYDQGAVNPHVAAHMGQYAFRPPAALGPFDPGLSPWLGQAVWIEAHYQNPPQARPAQSAGLVQRFGDLSPAWILQALMPLLIVMAGFAAIAGEREGGNLRLQLMQGARPLPLLAGKAGAMFGGAALLVTGILLVGGGFTTLTGGINADGLLRLASAWVVYLLYAAVWAALTVGVSALAATARGALLALLCLWMTSVVLVPRLAAEQAIRSHPVPSAGEFWNDVTIARQAGVTGHDVGNPAMATLQKEVLAQYGVTSLEELPVDFSGIALQKGEEYSDTIYDRLYGDLAAIEDAQATSQRWFAPLSPAISVRFLSMGLAGSDLLHQRAFAAAAETHRRTLQRQLNAEQTRTGKGRNNANTADRSFWETVRTFTYRSPGLETFAERYLADLAIILGWVVAALAFLAFAARRLGKRA
ncbi:ABC-2 type transport system permease protein [Polymorphobacter multimanifer]|uniref:ABC-2 type transport system permease protein n=1 Tax=Polymorphobacter multimanifer TaxID=1070431 RepID=A0A841LK52_9SPHN|nr:DUF3526 domain-containing protein [Polymorphobacter multimanifer]MBB6229348.1 ABC-2 type transport system permease protein [Polymorphobacter multimanifer]